MPMPDAAAHNPSPLLLACLLAHTELADALLALPVEWDFSETAPPSGNPRPGSPKAPGWPLISLLLRERPPYWSRDPHLEGPARDGMSASASTSLAMLARGASLLHPPSPHGASPLAAAIDAKRLDFLEAVSSHPEFRFERVQGLLCSSGKELLSEAILTDQIPVVRWLLERAGWPADRPDRDGRLPLGLSRSKAMTETLLSLGADPSLRDAAGQSALARAQEIESTPEREGAMALLASALRKGSSPKDPAALEALREENAAALIKAAELSPKSTLTKLIASFKFDVSKLRDPKTGRTPLMAAFLGGRVASAEELLARGCSLGALDAQGIQASAYLMLGREASGSSGASEHLLHRLASSFEWSGRSPAGLPLALQPSILLPLLPDHERRDLPARVLRAAQRALLLPEDWRGASGESFAAAYLGAAGSPSSGWRLRENIALACLRASEHASQADGALLSLGALLSRRKELRLEAKELSEMFARAESIPIDELSRSLLPLAIASLPSSAREAIAEARPSYLARLESFLLEREASEASDPDAASRHRPRSL